MGSSFSSSNHTAYKVPNTGISNVETSSWRNARCLELNQGELVSTFWPGVTTCHDAFLHGVSNFPNNRCLGVRVLQADGRTRGKYVWETYQDVFEKVTRVSSALRNLGISKNSKIGIYSINRPEWIVAINACYSQSFISVPLYDTIGDGDIIRICQETEMVAVFCSADKIERISSMESNLPNLRFIVGFDYNTDSEVIPRESSYVKVLGYDQLLEYGRSSPVDFVPPSPSDIAIINYTSKTFSETKGCVLTHANLIAEISGCMSSGIQVYPSDVHCSYLPLAHMYERLLVEACLTSGSAIGFYSGELETILDDVSHLKPTIFASIPRIFQKVSNRILQIVQSSGGFYQSLFDTAFQSKLEAIRNKSIYRSYFWDTFVFSFIRSCFGGRVRLVISSSAQLLPDVCEFLQVTLSCPVLQGYGLTETAGACSIQLSGTRDVMGNVGVPLPCNEIKLISLPELGYIVSQDPPRGEICIRGKNVFIGYLHTCGKVENVLDSDGWLHTGDVGKIDKKGCLHVIDRLRSIFKESSSESVGVEMVENVLSSSSYVSQIFIHGDLNQPELVAIVIPYIDAIRSFISSDDLPGLDNAGDAELCGDERIRKMVLQDLQSVGKSMSLLENQKVMNLALESEAFSIENGMLSATFKKQRVALFEKYEGVIHKLHQELSQLRSVELNHHESICNVENNEADVISRACAL